MSLDAYAGVEGEPAAVLPLRHLLAIVFFEQAAPHERPQDATVDLGLHRLGVVRVQCLHLTEPYAELGVGLENAVYDANVEMGMLVERGAEPVDEGCPAPIRALGPEPGQRARRCRSTASRKMRKALLSAVRSCWRGNSADASARRAPTDASADGAGQAIDQVGGGLCHAAGVT